MIKNRARVALSALLSVVTAFALSVPAFAGITINGAKSDQAYTAYQILTGEFEAGKLKNTTATWGSDVNGSAVIAATESVLSTPLPTNAQDWSAQISGIGSDSSEAKQLARLLAQGNALTGPGVDPSQVTAPGYYLILDTSAAPSEEDGAVVTAPILVLYDGTADIDLNLKGEPVTIEKTIDGKKQDSVQVGQDVPFTLNVTIGSNYKDFLDENEQPFYKLLISDQLPNELTFKEVTSIKVGDRVIDVSTGSPISYNGGVIFTEPVVKAGAKITFDFKTKDLPALFPGADLSGEVIEIKYLATVNENVDSHDVFENDALVEEYSNNPNDEDSFGKTPHDKTRLFLFELDITKTNGSEPLAGAVFALKNSDGKYYPAAGADAEWIAYSDSVTKQNLETAGVKLVTTGADGKINFDKLPAGQYELVEVEAPRGYEKLANNPTITIEVDESDLTADPKVTVVGFDGDATLSGNNTLIQGDITNEPDDGLPETGGMGAFIYVGVGLMLATIAAVGLKVRGRRNAE